MTRYCNKWSCFRSSTRLVFYEGGSEDNRGLKSGILHIKTESLQGSRIKFSYLNPVSWILKCLGERSEYECTTTTASVPNIAHRLFHQASMTFQCFDCHRGAILYPPYFIWQIEDIVQIIPFYCTHIENGCCVQYYILYQMIYCHIYNAEPWKRSLSQEQNKQGSRIFVCVVCFSDYSVDTRQRWTKHTLPSSPGPRNLPYPFYPHLILACASQNQSNPPFDAGAERVFSNAAINACVSFPYRGVTHHSPWTKYCANTDCPGTFTKRFLITT